MTDVRTPAPASVDLTQDGSFGRLSWEVLEPFGVRLHTDDLRAGLTPDEQAVAARLLYERGFIEASGQVFSKDEFRAFGGSVAPLLPEDHEANPILAVKAEDGGFGTRELAFHRDLSYAEHPFNAIALHALDVNPAETSTFLSSGVCAYDSLPSELKAEIAGLEVVTALHGRERDGSICENEVNQPGWPLWSHPVALPHPITGATVLFVCEMSSVRIVGWPADESEDLLQQLMKHHLSADNIYEHKWHNGDLFVFDNIGCLHARNNLEGVSKRTLQRLTMGKLSFPLAYPGFDMRSFTNATNGDNYMGKGGGKW